jgi:general secretion pathway protein D
MKKILILLLFFFCTSCAALEPSMKSRAPYAVDVPEKEAPAYEDTTPAAVADDKPARIKTEAGQLNARLEQIIADSPLRSREDLFSPGPRDADPTQNISFSFYDAELIEVIRVFMKLLEQDYLIHPEVSGRVSLFVDDDFNADQLLDLLDGVLRVNNMSMIRTGDDVLEFLPQSKVPRHITQDRIIFPDTDALPGRGQVIQGFRLNFIAASEMVNILMPYLSQSAQVYAHESKGVLLVSDYPHSLEKVSDLVALFDESVFADVKARVFPLEYVNAEEAAEQLKSIAEKFGLERSDVGPRSRVSFLPLERLNMVLAVTRSEQVLDFVQVWVENLDQELPESITGRNQENIFVYYVQYGDAEEIIGSLQGIFDEKTDADTGRTTAGQQAAETDDDSGSDRAFDSVSGELSGPVRFMIDQTTNSILVRCNALDYPKIVAVIERLDQYPRQVLIEVVIAEVQLGDTSKLGVDWRYILSFGGGVEGDMNIRSGLDMLPKAIPGTGATFFIESSKRLSAALHAAVNEKNLQILSTPTLLASDNKPAMINIGDQVPVPTSSRRKLDETTTAETIDTTIQYRDTGIILRVTPKINKQGMVRMDISQEVSDLSTRRVEGVNAPIISTRHTETTVAVGDQQTIVIAGLMKQTRSKTHDGVPGFNRIPVVKHLFGYTEDQFENTELLIFITPHVILSGEDSGFLTGRFLERLDKVKADMR